MKKDIACKYQSKGSRTGILLSDKIDFQAKNITRDREDYFSNRSVYQEEGVYTPNNKVAKSIKQTDKTERRDSQVQNYS